MGYKNLLLDNDGTLMDFKKSEARGIAETMRVYGLPFSEEILALYSRTNQKCWEEFERGLLDRNTLLVERFRRLFRQLGINNADADAVAATYEKELAKSAYLMDGALEVCRELREHCRLYIVTNGVSSTQHKRYAISGLDRLVHGVFVSEDIGCPKPQKEYFAYVFRHIPDFRKEETLMVGDSLTADIRGGINAGIDTCWYNPAGAPKPADMEITYEIRDLRMLKSIVF